MAWLILIFSALLEAVWATALAASDGFSRPGPTVLFFIAAALSMVGLSWAMRTIPVGSAYAVWTGLGAVLTAAWAMITGAEAAGVLKIVFLAGIIACVAGLRIVENRADAPAASPTAGPAPPTADPGTRP